jgi:serine phosphatase RsbU (regulator of sigma subunit)/anti-sigma regulatory factor (Ser/Thr protein kinase)
LLWVLSVALNTVIAACFAMIAYTAYAGLKRTGQLRTNMLGVATAAMFGSCAVSHESHAFHMLMPIFGLEVDQGLAMRRSLVWHLDAIDGLTMLVAVWYWTLRPRFKSLLDGGVLFADLERRYQDQARELREKGRVADALQRALEPKDLPTTSAVAFDAAYESAENQAAVGGDWYDVFNLPDGRIGVSIGDVTGHGLDAAAATSRAREAIAAAAFTLDTPGEVLAAANRVLVQRASPIVTAIYGTIEPTTLRFEYATAGHPPPVLAFRDEPASFCDYDGLALGIEREAAFASFSLTLRRGALVVLYTDGVIENSRDLAEGEARLLAAVTRHASLSTPSPGRPILADALRGAPIRDDIAVLAIKFIGDPVVRDTGAGRVWTFDVKDAEAATRLRREVMTCVGQHASSTDAFDSELIVGELLSNVVKHTPGVIEVSLAWDVRPAVLAVEDRGDGFAPLPVLPADAYSENGRGMFLVSTLAADVRYVRAPSGGSRIEVSLPQIGDAEPAHRLNGSLPSSSALPAERG